MGGSEILDADALAIGLTAAAGDIEADAAGKDATRRSRTAAIPPVKLALKLITPSNGYWAASPSRIGSTEWP